MWCVQSGMYVYHNLQIAMDTLFDSIKKTATKKAVSATKQFLADLDPEERLAVVGIIFIALSLVPPEKTHTKHKGTKKP